MQYTEDFSNSSAMSLPRQRWFHKWRQISPH